MQEPRVYSLEEIETITQKASFRDKLINGLVDGFIALHRDEFQAAPIQTLTPIFNQDAQTCVKSGYFRNNPYYVIKVASGGAPWPSNSGNMQIYSQETGRMLALLLDEGILTEYRTAAVGALAVKNFGPNTISCIGILGTGIQARYQLKMIERVTACRHVKVWGRTNANLKKYCDEIGQQGWTVEEMSEPDELLKTCNIIVTTTCARESVLGNTVKQNDMIQCQLIVCIGADAPGKMELSNSLIEKAGMLIADVPEQSRHRGEFQRVKSSRSISALGQVLSDKSFQNPDGDVVIVDSSGVAVQDCIVAQMLLEGIGSK